MRRGAVANPVRTYRGGRTGRRSDGGYRRLAIERKHDAQGLLVTPGLSNPHTHLVHGGSREHELALKLKGMSNLEILAQARDSEHRSSHASGNGRGAVCEGESEPGYNALLRVTTADAKSGYGLTLEDELKQLRSLTGLNREHPVDLVSTLWELMWCRKNIKAAPENLYRWSSSKMLPEVKRQGMAEFCDVFCGTAYFLWKNRANPACRQGTGLCLKIHADEIEPIGGAQLAASWAAFRPSI